MMDRFALAYREQQQLFLLDKTYLVQSLFTVGGAATLSGRFVVQFFWNPALAVFITLALLGLGAWLLWVSVRDKRADWPILPLCLLPFAFLSASLSLSATAAAVFSLRESILTCLRCEATIWSSNPVLKPTSARFASSSSSWA